jgi:aconitate hydratase
MGKPQNLAQKLIAKHLVHGEMKAGSEIAIKIDQTLTQDATGTLIMLELEALGLKKVQTEISVQYIDHNLAQADFKNAEDHLFLLSAAKKFGFWYSRPGNGVSHPVHMERFGKPGKTLAGSDSHTPAAGSIGMLALGAGGIDVAFAILGEPMYLKMPQIMGVKLSGKLPKWVSAKDVILEMLRRYDVKGCRGMILEYYGDGLKCLSAMDRHVIANMGTELGATTTVFPSDEEVKRFLTAQERGNDWEEWLADKDAEYDKYEEIDLSKIEPLIALPSSPGNVVPVREVEGKDIYQAVVGSSANPGIRDYWIVSQIIKDKTIHCNVSLDINPSSRQVIQNLVANGGMKHLITAGARFHQAGCLGCIGIGQAPATDKISLRTMPRNFKGRSGTKDDLVYLCSPETAAASALTGKITDPRDLEKLFKMEYPEYKSPEIEITNLDMLLPPPENSEEFHLEKGPNIKTLPKFEKLKKHYELPVALKLSDNISTDDILKSGMEVLPFRSNIPEISKWLYAEIDKNFYTKAKKLKQEHNGHIVIAGENYAQGSSREHAAIVPRYLGQIAVIAKSYARLGWQNLINFGIIPLEFDNSKDYDDTNPDDVLIFENITQNLNEGKKISVINKLKKKEITVFHSLSKRQINVIKEGGIINYFNTQKKIKH